MKTQGRPKSTNIEDKRAYFGSDSIGKGPSSFLQESFVRAQTFKAQEWNKFKKANYK